MSTKTQTREFAEEIRQLLMSLKKDIEDDFRRDEEDDRPGMQVTVSSEDGIGWNYQTGDNSFSGDCYGDDHWAVVGLYRDSNCRELANDITEEIFDAIAECEF